MISLMIADDNVQWVEQLSTILTNDEDFKIVNKSYNGMDTLMSYTTLKPDVLLLDLNMPGIDGLEVIKYLSNITDEQYKKNIIVLSCDPMYQAKVIKLPKVKGMITKTWDLSFLIDIIKDIKETDSKKILVKNKIDNLFKNLDFDECLKGTTMLKDAIFTAFYNCTYLNNVESLIKEISHKYPNLNPKTIRSLMDKAITTMYELHDKNPNYLCTYFTDYYGFKPTTKHFVKYSVNYLNTVINC